MSIVIIILQIIIALGIYNVWLIRPQKKTPYRGGNTSSIKEEFSAYGLPTWFMYAVGMIKVLSATGLIVGIWIPVLTVPSAIVLLVMMMGALTMHVKIHDTFKQTAPALGMFVLLVGMLFLIS